MKSFFLFYFLFFLTSAALAVLARWLHPATFSPHVVTALLVLSVAAAVMHFWRHE